MMGGIGGNVELHPLDFQEWGAVWWGKNGSVHGGHYFLGITKDGATSVRIHKKDHKAVAAILRAFADKLDRKGAP